MPVIRKCPNPSCGKKLSIGSKFLGKQIKCPACGVPFFVNPSEQAAPPRQPAAPPPPPPPTPAKKTAEPAPEKRQPQPVPAKHQSSPPPAPQLPADASREIYPWETPPEYFARVEAYEQQGGGKTFLCWFEESLNTLSKPEALGPGVKADLKVYPDLVCVAPHEKKMGCLTMLLMIPALILAGPAGLLYLAVWLSDLVVGPIGYLKAKIMAKIMQMRLDLIAKRIRNNPKSSYAIKKLYKYADFLPRIWMRNDVVQILRVNIKRPVCGTRAIVVFVHDNPILKKPGCLETAFPMLVARRRLSFAWIKKDETLADSMAKEAADALGLEVVKARFAGSKLTLA